MSQSICLVANYVFSAENKIFYTFLGRMITEADISVKFLNSANMVQQLRLKQGQCDEAEVKSHEGCSSSVLEVTIFPIASLNIALRRHTKDTSYSDVPPSPQPLCLSQTS